MMWVEERHSTQRRIVEWYDTNSDLTITYSPATFRMSLFSDGRGLGSTEVSTLAAARVAVEFFDHAGGATEAFRLINAAALAEAEARSARHSIGYSVQYDVERNTYNVRIFDEESGWSRDRTSVPAHLLRIVKAELAAEYFTARTAPAPVPLPEQQESEKDALVERIARAVEQRWMVTGGLREPINDAASIVRSFKTGGSRA